MYLFLTRCLFVLKCPLIINIHNIVDIYQKETFDEERCNEFTVGG